MKLTPLLFGTLFTIQGALAVKLTPFLNDGLDSPVDIAFAPGEPERVYIVEQPGRIRIVEKGKLLPAPFLDIEKRVTSGGERGLLGLAFHPDYEKSRRYFVNYTNERPKLKTFVSEFKAGSPEEKILLEFDQPYSNHNGGQVAFGPDGYLYFSAGDGGSGGDPKGNGQNKATWLGKILRIDINQGAPYAIPKDNPFQGPGDRKEIFALGLRNVWRFSFDRETKLLFAGDVGQNRVEEIDIVERGGNYGWNTQEGTLCFKPTMNCSKQGLIQPIHEYPRKDGISITGGYVYRGKAIPALVGKYVYADFGSGKIWALGVDFKTKKSSGNELLLDSGEAVSSFGQAPDGELYVASYNGRIFKLTP